MYSSGCLLVCTEPPTSQAERSAKTGLWSRNWAADVSALPGGLHPAALSGTHRPKHRGRPSDSLRGQRSPISRERRCGAARRPPPWTPGPAPTPNAAGPHSEGRRRHTRLRRVSGSAQGPRVPGTNVLQPGRRALGQRHGAHAVPCAERVPEDVGSRGRRAHEA